MKTDIKRSIIRFINGEKRLFERLDNYYSSRKEYDKNDIFEQYLDLIMSDECPDYKDLLKVKRKILGLVIEK